MASPALARESGGFVLTAAVDALAQPGGGRPVARLEAGRSYAFVKRGGPGGTWCKRRAGGREGWVACSAGTLGGATTPVPKPPREAQVSGATSLAVGLEGPRNAFTHVFCGDDWARDEVGGLHWWPGYAELERAGRVYSAPDVGGGAWRIWCGTRHGSYGIASLYPIDDTPTRTE